MKACYVLFSRALSSERFLQIARMYDDDDDDDDSLAVMHALNDSNNCGRVSATPPRSLVCCRIPGFGKLFLSSSLDSCFRRFSERACVSHFVVDRDEMMLLDNLYIFIMAAHQQS